MTHFLVKKKICLWNAYDSLGTYIKSQQLPSPMQMYVFNNSVWTFLNCICLIVWILLQINNFLSKVDLENIEIRVQ